MKHGLWMVVLGVVFVAAACGDTRRDARSGADDDSDTAGQGGAADSPPEGGSPPAVAGTFGGGGRAEGGAGPGAAGEGAVGGGAPVNQCPTERCGGDVLGTWEIVQSCVGSLTGVETCPGITGDDSALVRTGTITYNDDQTYTSVLSTTGTLVLAYPLSCIEPVSCDELGRSLEAAVQAGVSQVICEEIEDACSCEVTFDQTFTETGTYETDAIGLRQKADTTLYPKTLEYCVTGDTLTLSAAVSQSYVLERR